MSLNQIDDCVGCGERRVIVNRKHMMCNDCNRHRLHPGQAPKTYSFKRSIPKAHSTKSRVVMKRDEDVYEEVYNLHMSKRDTCRCEECSVELISSFKIEGKIVQRFRYSHILTKAAYPEHRHNVHNFNILCLKHHMQWETGDRRSMNIFEGNQKIIAGLTSSYK